MRRNAPKARQDVDITSGQAQAYSGIRPLGSGCATKPAVAPQAHQAWAWRYANCRQVSAPCSRLLAPWQCACARRLRLHLRPWRRQAGTALGASRDSDFPIHSEFRRCHFATLPLSTCPRASQATPSPRRATGWECLCQRTKRGPSNLWAVRLT